MPRFPEPQETDNPPAGSEVPFEQRLLNNVNALGAGYGTAQLGAGIVKSVPKVAEGLADLIGNAPRIVGNEAGSVSLGAPELVNVGKVAGKDIMVPKPHLDDYLKSINEFESTSGGKELDFADHLREMAHDKATTAAFKQAFPEENLGNDELYDQVRQAVGKFADDVLQKPEMMSRGGKVSDGPIIEDSTLEGFAKMLKDASGDYDMDKSTDTEHEDKKKAVMQAMGYDDGGAVQPQQPSLWDRITSSPLATIANGVSDITSLLGGNPSPAVSDLSTSPAVQNYAQKIAPIAQRAGSELTNGAIPAPAPQAPAPQPAPAPAPAPQPTQQAASAPAPQPSAKPQAMDLLSKLTDNDSDKMNALISNLQDHDKRAAFAQALAVIGDTFGNMGNAKAGQSPEGFTGLKAVQGITDQDRQRMIDQLQMKLASDPNSQTSRLAQQILMQGMNIQPNDPRAKAIMAMPAQTIMTQMPQLGEMVKVQLGHEANQLAQKQLESSIADRQAQLEIARENAGVQMAKQQGDLTAGLAKDTSIFNPLHYKAQNAAAQVAGINPASAPQANLPVVHTHADYNKLPRGARYQNANGEVGVKS